MEPRSSALQSFQPISGGTEMRVDRTQTNAIMPTTRLRVRLVAYWIGSVIAQYRSMAIAHRFRMLQRR